MEAHKILVGIGLSLALFYFFWWIGLKGIIGFILGMGIMAYLILSENTTLMSAITMLKIKKSKSVENCLKSLEKEEEK